MKGHGFPGRGSFPKKRDFFDACSFKLLKEYVYLSFYLHIPMHSTQTLS
jgi:hypothetical protein